MLKLLGPGAVDFRHQNQAHQRQRLEIPRVGRCSSMNALGIPVRYRLPMWVFANHISSQCYCWSLLAFCAIACQSKSCDGCDNCLPMISESPTSACHQVSKFFLGNQSGVVPMGDSAWRTWNEKLVTRCSRNMFTVRIKSWDDKKLKP